MEVGGRLRRLSVYSRRSAGLSTADASRRASVAVSSPTKTRTDRGTDPDSSGGGGGGGGGAVADDHLDPKFSSRLYAYSLKRYQEEQVRQSAAVVERYQLEREDTLKRQAARREESSPDEGDGGGGGGGDADADADAGLPVWRQDQDGQGALGGYPVRSGRGRHVYSNGAVYEGEWVDDVREGYGVMQARSGDVYEGEWVRGKRHGHGVHRTARGMVYEGPWARGVRHGVGILTHPDGTKEVDRWVNGRRLYDHSLTPSSPAEQRAMAAHDKAVLGRRASVATAAAAAAAAAASPSAVSAASAASAAAAAAASPSAASTRSSARRSVGSSGGQRQEGKIEQVTGLPVGGGVYTGRLVDGKRDGDGEWVAMSPLTHEVAARYVGEWRGGKRHGKGVFRDTATVYDGEWENGKRHGAAVVTTISSGAVFDSVWERGRRVQATRRDSEPEPAAAPRSAYGKREFTTGAAYVGSLELRRAPVMTPRSRIPDPKPQTPDEIAALVASVAKEPVAPPTPPAAASRTPSGAPARSGSTHLRRVQQQQQKTLQLSPAESAAVWTKRKRRNSLYH